MDEILQTEVEKETTIQERINMEEDTEIIEETENTKYKTKKKIIMIGSAIIILGIIILVFFNGNFSKTKKLQKLFPDATDIKIICSEPLEFSNDKSDENSWEYVLFHANINGTELYYTCPVDYKNKLINTTSFKNPFMRALRTYICGNCDEDTNKEFYYELKKNIEEKGLTYFENGKNSSNFLRKITGKNGIIPTVEARNVMYNALYTVYGEEKYNEWLKKDEFRLLFDSQNALPKVATYKATERKYNWNYPEAFLGTLDAQTKAAFNHMYGPAYTMETIWYPGVIDEETGDMTPKAYCLSLENVKTLYKAYETGDKEK